jgi:hypothetical protein
MERMDQLSFSPWSPTAWLLGDNNTPSAINTYEGIGSISKPKEFEAWPKSEKSSCSKTLKVNDNRFRLLIHCLPPKWFAANSFSPDRISK